MGEVLNPFEEEYGMSVSPLVAEAVYGSVRGFVDSVDRDETSLYENGVRVDVPPSSALELRKAVAG